MSFIGFLVLVVDHQQGRGLGVFHVGEQVRKALHVLGLLEHHHLVRGHHREPACRVRYLSGLGVLSIQDRLVKALLRFAKYISCNKGAYQVDVVGFISPQKINRSVDLVFQVAD